MDFNFKEWSDLYEVDPEAYERRRGAVLEHFIQSAEPERRLALEQTLFRIEMSRKRSKTPLKTALEASNMMWESFGKLREQLDVLQQATRDEALPSNGLRLVRSEDAGGDVTASTHQPPTISQGAQTAQTGKVLRFPDNMNRH
ncbi:MAG: DUF3135 domain-containing protein [Limnobacter sp.]|nr:DUF3135 domain-containing protein [Limnobacter sp.]